MLLEEIDAKIDSWGNELSKEALKIKEKAEGADLKSVYSLIIKDLVASLKPVIPYEEGFFKANEIINLDLPKGEFSETDKELFKNLGIRSFGSVCFVSVPLLIQKLEQEKEKIMTTGRGTMDFRIDNQHLIINIRIKGRQLKQEDNPTLERKATE